jgi:hypothetical protein
MKKELKQFNIGDLIKWNVDSSVAYITQISGDESIFITYLNSDLNYTQYHHTVPELSNYIFFEELVHYPIRRKRKTNEKTIQCWRLVYMDNR